MKNDSSKPIPNQLRRYRKIRGLTQGHVAKVLGLKSTSMISRWEHGRCLPSFHNIIRLSVIYRTMMDALFFDFKRTIGNEIMKREGLVNKTQH
jgi:transcriptional regulator with XRE-family HTH domain